MSFRSFLMKEEVANGFDWERALKGRATNPKSLNPKEDFLKKIQELNSEKNKINASIQGFQYQLSNLMKSKEMDVGDDWDKDIEDVNAQLRNEKYKNSKRMAQIESELKTLYSQFNQTPPNLPIKKRPLLFNPTTPSDFAPKRLGDFESGKSPAQNYLATGTVTPTMKKPYRGSVNQYLTTGSVS